jgi:hypothetical protein
MRRWRGRAERIAEWDGATPWEKKFARDIATERAEASERDLRQNLRIEHFLLDRRDHLGA